MFHYILTLKLYNSPLSMSQYKEISSRSWRLASATPCSWAYNPTSHPWRGISLSRAELGSWGMWQQEAGGGMTTWAVCDGMQCHASNCALQEHVARCSLGSEMTFHTALIQRAGVLLNFAINDLNMCPSCDVMRKQRRRAVLPFQRAQPRAENQPRCGTPPDPLVLSLVNSNSSCRCLALEM